MPNPIVSATATVDPTGSQPFVQVYDSPNNFGVFTLTLNDGTTGATLGTLASNANSYDSPQVRYPLPVPSNQAAGKILVCQVTLVPAGTQGPLQFTLNVVQDDRQIDNGNAKLNIDSAQPENGAIRIVLQ
jgi:hypothetical protein